MLRSHIRIDFSLNLYVYIILKKFTRKNQTFYSKIFGGRDWIRTSGTCEVRSLSRGSGFSHTLPRAHMAERVGFEPTGRMRADTQAFKARPLWPLRYLSRCKKWGISTPHKHLLMAIAFAIFATLTVAVTLLFGKGWQPVHMRQYCSWPLRLPHTASSSAGEPWRH